MKRTFDSISAAMKQLLEIMAVDKRGIPKTALIEINW
jgi:hypothetical protein